MSRMHDKTFRWVRLMMFEWGRASTWLQSNLAQSCLVLDLVQSCLVQNRLVQNPRAHTALQMRLIGWW